MAAPACSQAAAQNWSGLTDINKIFKHEPQQQLTHRRAPKFKWVDAPKKWSFEQTCSSSVERNSENIRSHMNIFLTLDSFFGLDVRVHSYFCINKILPTSFILYFHQTFCWHELQIMTHKSQQLRMKIQPRRHSSSRAKHLHGIVR